MAGLANGQSLGLIVEAGQVNLHKNGGQAITGGNNVGLTVQANALVLDENNYQIHSDSAIPLPVVLSGGAWDLNGWNENVDQLSISSAAPCAMPLLPARPPLPPSPVTRPCSAAQTANST